MPAPPWSDAVRPWPASRIYVKAKSLIQKDFRSRPPHEKRPAHRPAPQGGAIYQISTRPTTPQIWAFSRSYPTLGSAFMFFRTARILRAHDHEHAVRQNLDLLHLGVV